MIFRRGLQGTMAIGKRFLMTKKTIQNIKAITISNLDMTEIILIPNMTIQRKKRIIRAV